jgi:phage-related protein (TIGR01555 family)
MSILDSLRSIVGRSAPVPPPVALLESSARQDAAPTPAAYSSAGLVNSISGLGAARDSGQAGRPNLQRLNLADGEVEALVRAGVYGRLAGLMPDYATQQGWTVSDGTPLTDPLAKRMQDLRIAHHLGRADELARAYGRGALWPVVDDGAASLSEPLDVATVTKVHAIHSLSYRDFYVSEWETDPTSPNMGGAKYFTVCPANTGRSYQRVHASRLAVLIGDPLTPSDQSNSRLGYPLADRWWDAIRDMGSVSASGARAAQELSVGIFKVGTLAAKQTGGEASTFIERMALMALGKSIAQAVVLNGDEEYRRESIPAAGFDSFSDTAREMLSLVTGYPEQLLFGTAPGGLNTDGDSWWRAWTNVVAAYQLRRYMDPIRWICRILYAEAGGEPAKWDVTFNPLGALDSKSRAEVRLLTAQADAIEIANTVLLPEEVRERYSSGRYDFELQPLTTTPAEGEASAPADLAAAGAALQGLLTGQTLRTDGPLALCLLAPLDAAGLAIFGDALAAVRAILPDLEVEPRPHITLLYLGDQPSPEQVVNVFDRARRVLAGTAPAVLQAGAVRVFDAPAPGQPSPIVIEYRSRALTTLNAALLAACAPAVTAPQHDRYRAHVTIGYARPTDEQVTALEAVTAPGRHVVAEVSLMQGDREMGRPMRLGA